MGPHDTWFTVLPFWGDLEAFAAPYLKRETEALIFKETHFTLSHVAGALAGAIFLMICTYFYRRSLHDKTKGVVPPRRFGLAAMVDGFVGAAFQFTADAMGEQKARTWFPFIGALGMFIFICNIQGLIPGFGPPTDTLKTNAGLAILVFLVYNAVAIREHGFGYLLHFMGPKFSVGPVPEFYWVAPLLFPVEIISHLARPVSLSLRLMGNMLGDHKVVMTMMALFAIGLPVPFLLLGVLVAIVQTLIFSVLTVIYISLALEHAEEH